MDEVREILADEDLSVHSEKLGALGPAAAPVFWGVLSGQALLEDDLDLVSAGRAMRRGMEDWDGEKVTQHLLDTLTPNTPLPERLVAVRLMGWTNSDAGLTGVFAALSEVEPIQLRSRWVTLALDSALKELISPASGRLELLLELLPDLPRELIPSLVEAVGSLPDRHVMLVLSEVAKQEPHFTREVLGKIGAYEHCVPRDSVQGCITLARENLRSRDKVMRRLAAQALARLGDVGSFHDLAWQLEDEDSGARRVALEALCTLSGLNRDWDRQRWLSWFESEEEWLADAERLAADLRGSDPFRAKVASRELASHALFGASVSALMVPGLSHSDVGIRVATCEGLERLGQVDSVPALIGALGDRNPKVRIAARVSLVRLTRVDRGEDRAAWDAWWRSR